MLDQCAVGSAARGRYDAAIARLKIFCTFFGLVLTLFDSDSLDEILVSYLQFLYDESLPMCWGADTLSALQDLMPKLRKELPHAWRCYSAWQRLEPPQRAKPLMLVILQYWLVFLLNLISDVNSFVVLSLVMHMCLVFHLFRPAEVRGLTWADVKFSTVFTHGRWHKIASIAIDHSKTSIRKNMVEYVQIDDAFTVLILELLYEMSSSDSDPLWPFSLSTFHTFLKELQKSTGMSGYVPYSFKRGGATCHFLRYHAFDLLVQAGRWASVKSARVYIEDALAAQARLRTPQIALDPQHRAFLRRFVHKYGRGGSSLILET